MDMTRNARAYSKSVFALSGQRYDDGPDLHTFCNDDTAGRNYHVLMQIAYTLWQVFDTGVLSRLSDGCRKPSQEMWAKMLFVAILVLGLASVPRVAVGAFRMRRFHLGA